jgi:hemerythrin superfamily protein
VLSKPFGGVRALVRELRDHADHEEKYIHPLLRSCAPALASQLEDEHADIDKQMVDLERVEGSADLYRRLASFTASSLRQTSSKKAARFPPCGKDIPTRS